MYLLVGSFFLLSYLLGSIPTAYIVGRCQNRGDIRDLGDGNLGAKNTFQSVGKKAGIIVALADVLKGAFPVLLARYAALPDHVVLLSGACTVIGHDFPVFLHFKGGQGMAVSIGIFLVLFPLEMSAALIILAFLLAISRNWDVSWGTAFLGMIILLMWRGSSFLNSIFAVALLLLIGFRKLAITREFKKSHYSSE